MLLTTLKKIFIRTVKKKNDVIISSADMIFPTLFINLLLHYPAFFLHYNIICLTSIPNVFSQHLPFILSMSENFPSEFTIIIKHTYALHAQILLLLFEYWHHCVRITINLDSELKLET